MWRDCVSLVFNLNFFAKHIEKLTFLFLFFKYSSGTVLNLVVMLCLSSLARSLIA